LFDEFVVVGCVLVLAMVVFALEQDMQADLPVVNVHIPLVRFDELTGSKVNNAGQDEIDFFLKTVKNIGQFAVG
jgi:hypothetical protein